MQNIIIQQPQPFDLVDKEIMIAGVGVGFEGTLSIYISDGHYEVKSYAQAGAYMLQQFQAKVKIPDNIEFKLDQLTLVVTDDTAGGEGTIPTVIIPLLYGPKILKDYRGYWLHKVKEKETLSTIAQEYYNDNSMWKVIYRANINTISNPDLIYPNQILRIPRTDYF